MPYAGQTWTDGVTPLDAAHMSALDAGVVGAVDVDNVVAAASQIVANKLLGTDAQPAFRVLGDGKIDWGPGGATAPDTTLYRAAANDLRTGGKFTAAMSLEAATEVVARLGSATQVIMGAAGPGAVAGLNIQGEYLYRSAAGQLKTDGQFRAGTDLVSLAGDVWARFGDANTQVKVGNDGSGRAGIVFGGAGDTWLYRTAANALKTPGALFVGTSAVIETGYLAVRNDAGSIYFGAADDTRLYRSAANLIMTPGAIRAADYLSSNGYVFAHHGNANQVVLGHTGAAAGAGMYFGLAADTSLYRAAANTLETPGTMNVGAMGINVPSVGGRGVEFGAPDSGGAGYRMMRVLN